MNLWWICSGPAVIYRSKHEWCNSSSIINYRSIDTRKIVFDISAREPLMAERSFCFVVWCAKSCRSTRGERAGERKENAPNVPKHPDGPISPPRDRALYYSRGVKAAKWDWNGTTKGETRCIVQFRIFISPGRNDATDRDRGREGAGVYTCALESNNSCAGDSSSTTKKATPFELGSARWIFSHCTWP